MKRKEEREESGNRSDSLCGAAADEEGEELCPLRRERARLPGIEEKIRAVRPLRR